MEDDALSQVWKILRGYKKQQQHVQQLESKCQELAALKESVRTPSAPSCTPGGSRGTSTSSMVERQAERCERIDERLASLRLDMQEARRGLHDVECAVMHLGEEERQIIDLHFLQGRSWVSIALSMYMSESTVRKKARTAARSLALSLHLIPLSDYLAPCRLPHPTAGAAASCSRA
ncbi:MAG: hypothetical protein MR698_03365 [Selenomonas sp.]|nr:hypothetical protein [Selenomonas sp.]